MTETADYDKSATPKSHHLTHEKDGNDETSVAGLSGVLATRQDAGAIMGVIVNDEDKADQKVLGYDEATNRIVFLAAAAAGIISLDVFEAINILADTITIGLSHAIT